MNRWVEISFDCLPLRSLGRFDIPVDATPDMAALYQRIQRAAEKHGLHNTYYLVNADCTFHLVNHDTLGMVEFWFEGVVLTDPEDRKTLGCDLDVRLHREVCDWLTEPVVQWFAQTVREAVRVEFDRFIDAGDLQKTIKRLEQIESLSDAHGGYRGLGI